MEQRGPRRRREKGEEVAFSADLSPKSTSSRLQQNVVGPAVRRLRYAQHITQDTPAARCAVAGCDLSRGTLAKIEAQIRGVSEVKLFTLALVLRVHMDQLFPAGFAAKLKTGAW